MRGEEKMIKVVNSEKYAVEIENSPDGLCKFAELWRDKYVHCEVTGIYMYGSNKLLVNLESNKHNMKVIEHD